MCDFEWGRQVVFTDIPEIEEKLSVNILILDINNLPIAETTKNIFNSIMYKNFNKERIKSYWLLFHKQADGGGHYHTISNIKGFLCAKYFCNSCLSCFQVKETYEKHNCADCEAGVINSRRKVKQMNGSKIGKEISRYLNEKAKKGGEQEIEEKIEQLKDYDDDKVNRIMNSVLNEKNSYIRYRNRYSYKYAYT